MFVSLDSKILIALGIVRFVSESSLFDVLNGPLWTKLDIYHLQKWLHSYENVRNYGKAIIKIYSKSPHKTYYQAHYSVDSANIFSTGKKI